jgi:quinol monooxygenase YgiN
MIPQLGSTMKSLPVRMSVKWRVPPSEAQSITTALQGLMLYTRAEHGCAGCSVSTEMGALVLIHYVETWETENDLKRQIRSQRFSALAELVERATADPAVEFALPDGTRGLEYAKTVRRLSLT